MNMWIFDDWSGWLPRLLDGLLVSLQVTGLSLALGFSLGMVFALLASVHRHPSRVAHRAPNSDGLRHPDLPGQCACVLAEFARAAQPGLFHWRRNLPILRHPHLGRVAVSGHHNPRELARRSTRKASGKAPGVSHHTDIANRRRTVARHLQVSDRRASRRTTLRCLRRELVSGEPWA